LIISHKCCSRQKALTYWAAGEGPKTEAGKRWVVYDGSGVLVAV